MHGSFIGQPRSCLEADTHTRPAVVSSSMYVDRDWEFSFHSTGPEDVDC